MGSYVDFQKLKAEITIVQVVEMLGIKSLTPHGQALRGECPLCQVTNPRGFIVTPAKNSFYCFSEGYTELLEWVKKELSKEIKYITLIKYAERNFGSKIKVARKSHVKKNELSVEAFKKTSVKNA